MNDENMSRSDLGKLCESRNVRAEVRYGVDENKRPEWAGREMHPWTITLRYRGRRLTVPFFTGSALTGEPSAADVLGCLVSDARATEQDFDEWCGDLGFDTDSCSAKKTYDACVKMGHKVRRLLGADFDAFCNAEH